MIEKFITSLISCLVTGVIGFLTGKVKSIKKEKEDLLKENRQREKTQNEAIKSLLRADMVRTYYKYKDIKKIPYFEKEAWDLLYSSYKELDGNSFIDNLKREIDTWEIGE